MFLETRAGRIAYVAGLTLVLSSLGFWATIEIGSPTSSVAQAAMTDAPFARTAAFGEMHETQFAHLAQDKSESDVVRNFASEIEADHTQTRQSLDRAAFKENISLPTALATKDQASYDRLSGLSGTQFDRIYTCETVRNFEQDVQVYRHEVSAGNDDVIRNFASQTLPMLEKHLAAARRLARVVSTNGKKSANENAAARGRTR